MYTYLLVYAFIYIHVFWMLGCYRLDAFNRGHNRGHSQERKADNMTSNLLWVANNSAIAATSKMTTGISACAMICACIIVV